MSSYCFFFISLSLCVCPVLSLLPWTASDRCLPLPWPHLVCQATLFLAMYYFSLLPSTLHLSAEHQPCYAYRPVSPRRIVLMKASVPLQHHHVMSTRSSFSHVRSYASHYDEDAQ